MIVAMSGFSPEALPGYLSRVYGGVVSVRRLSVLGAEADPGKVKEYGYGTPIRVDFTVDGAPKSVVISTVRSGGFGHDNMSDRAAIMLWQSEAFNTLPRHVHAVDVGAYTKTGGMTSLGGCAELFLVYDHAEGREYYHDLNRIKDSGSAAPLDLQRVEALAGYLAELHSVKHADPGYYERRTRELLGHNECIFGIADSYPAGYPLVSPGELADIEKRCVDWRWRLKGQHARLSRVHGDFHPFNILFREETDFTLLDRSRGSWGEPADDLAGLGINYLFWGLMYWEEFGEPFRGLWNTFFETYLRETGDQDVLAVIQPYLTFRALVVANPIWYPHISAATRRSLLNFARNILEEEIFDYRHVERLLEARR
jgi:hypothetical protein